METAIRVSFTAHLRLTPPPSQTHNLSFCRYPLFLHRCGSPRLRLRAAFSQAVDAESVGPDAEADDEGGGEKFDWYSQWYPVAPVCDLDNRRPHAKTVMGLNVVVWWDRNKGQWRVFDDSCPHRLAPLSEGRIDQWGRLQCVYHGWCFDGEGSCKFIPQEPLEGPKFHTFKRACAAAYPSIEQNKIVWFWPSSDSMHKDISAKKRPPYIPELDDPTFTTSMTVRDIPYGYEVLIENLMDPAHVPYAHYGIMRVGSQDKSKIRDREGGRPLNIKVVDLNETGFLAMQENGFTKFMAPCIYYFASNLNDQSTDLKKQRRLLLIFVCIPVSPGKSRLILSFPRNFAIWMDKLIPRWIFHLGQNLVLDSDLNLLHLEKHANNQTM